MSFFFFTTTWICRNSPAVCHSLCLHLFFFSLILFFHPDLPYFSRSFVCFAFYFSSRISFLKGELSTRAKGGGREGSLASSVPGWPDSDPWPPAAVQGPAGTQGPICAGQPPGLLTKLHNCGTSGETELQRSLSWCVWDIWCFFSIARQLFLVLTADWSIESFGWRALLAICYSTYADTELPTEKWDANVGSLCRDPIYD